MTILTAADYQLELDGLQATISRTERLGDDAMAIMKGFSETSACHKAANQLLSTIEFELSNLRYRRSHLRQVLAQCERDEERAITT